MLPFIPDPFLADESLNGYLLRLAEENFIGSLNVLLRPTGIRAKTCYSAHELAAIADYHGLDMELLLQLSEVKAVNGSMSAGAFVRASAVPSCPACLREAGYVRQAWHHELVTACPSHGLVLIDHCPQCSSHLDLSQSGVCQCRCGYMLTEADAAPADAANFFVSSLLTAHPNDAVAPWPWAEVGALPKDIDRFLVFLANQGMQKPQRKGAAISFSRAQEINRACYVLSQDLPVHFRGFVEARVQAANQLESSRFIKNLGRWYQELNTSFASEDYAAIRETTYRVILEKANAPINRKMKQIGAELLGLKSTFTAAEAARLLGSSTDRIFSYVKSGRLPGKILNGASVEFCLVDRGAVEAEQRAAAELIAGKDLLKALNITRRVRERLVECGVLLRVAEVEKPLFARGDYRIQDIQRLIAILDAGCSNVGAATLIGLDEISAKRYSSLQTAELYRQIFAGRIRPVLKVAGMQGLAAFKFDQDEIKSHLREEPSLFELSITDLVKLTRWKHETIKSWVDSGLLGSRTETHNGQRKIHISVAHLVTFLSTHVVVADAAVRLGSKSIWVAGPLKTKGALAKETYTTSEGSFRGLLFSTDALINLASGRASDWMRADDQHLALSASESAAAFEAA
ncbi:TniQ family protein [Pseudomonas sp. JG-B]|uniref:TniQ family protein n=1 Tax=Pseudomonas sp. JG-B TaxID=2603214 RepID=UPI00129E043E|nr:TniQ family protein [Pseudomonas sp. JG-B]MRK21535.1 hypothetical protein [Pseudomonas sp. JG-B]